MSLGSTISTLASLQMPNSTPGPRLKTNLPPMSSPLPSSLAMRKLERSLSSLISTLRCERTNWFPFSRIDVLTISFLSINQCCSFSSMHPPSPINLGEVWTKQIYEAVRGSPQWNNTLFIITFDEHGVSNKISRTTQYYPLILLIPPQGFSDHVPPPVGVPNPDGLTYTETAADGKNYTFDFTRLGVRCVSISSWGHLKKI